MNKKIIYLIAGAVLVGNVVLGLFLFNNSQSKKAQGAVSTVSPVITQTKVLDTFSYQGEDGKDALTIMKEKTSAKQNSSGLVISINGREADDSKKEFWAFYVNGEMAQVGPAEYQTKNTDKVEWKIEQY